MLGCTTSRPPGFFTIEIHAPAHRLKLTRPADAAMGCAASKPPASDKYETTESGSPVKQHTKAKGVLALENMDETNKKVSGAAAAIASNLGDTCIKAPRLA
jgi:hypothetical protein